MAGCPGAAETLPATAGADADAGLPQAWRTAALPALALLAAGWPGLCLAESHRSPVLRRQK